ncbi:hypothetical protein [Desulfolutivibrio sulfoxidireducens]|nr:hypothetical protein [Desulfolutivibrio sulfoxidireducens]
MSRLNEGSLRGLVQAVTQLRRLQAATRMILRKKNVSGRSSTP